MMRQIRDLVKWASVQVFHAGQHVGVDILPRHFYSSVPDIRELRRNRAWRKPLSMAGIAGADLDSQLAFLRQYCPTQSHPRNSLSELVDFAARENGELGYGPTETLVLYSFIHNMRPKRIVQIGAGFSTAVILRAAADAGYDVSLTCIDPFPTDYLRRLASAGKITLVAEPAQQVAVSTLTSLQPKDLLFVDSTHTVKAGSEVNYLILEAFPRLPLGCFIHVHDIFFPYDYQRTIFTQPFFSGECTLLHAYLCDNSRCALRVSLSMLHYGRTEALKQLFPEYSPAGNDDGVEAPPAGHFPSAAYLEMVGSPLQ